MPISVSCACGKQLRARDEMAGKRAKCPGCGCILTIPAAETGFEPVYAPDDAPSIPYDVSVPARPIPRPAPAIPARETAHTAPVFHPPTTSVTDSTTSFTLKSSAKFRHLLYFAFLLSLAPLVIYSFVNDKPKTIEERLDETLDQHPEAKPVVEKVVESMKPGDDLDDLFTALPDHRLSGAFLAHDSYAHWAIAMLAGAVFLGLLTVMFPGSQVPWRPIVLVSLFTGTIGILMLLGVQWIAFNTGGVWFRGGGRLAILMLIIKFIGFSYAAALDPDNGFIVSMLGFTFGVGLCEELCKTLPLLWHFRSSATLNWRAACLWGLASGIGFGISEGITYSTQHYNGIHGGGIYFVRFVSCVGLHAMWSGASAVWIFKNQDKVAAADSFLGWMAVIFLVIAIPMVLHGFYDTLLKKEMNMAALAIALLSFGWLAFVIEWTRWQEEKHGLWASARA